MHSNYLNTISEVYVCKLEILCTEMLSQFVPSGSNLVVLITRFKCRPKWW